MVQEDDKSCVCLSAPTVEDKITGARQQFYATSSQIIKEAFGELLMGLKLAFTYYKDGLGDADPDVSCFGYLHFAAFRDADLIKRIFYLDVYCELCGSRLRYVVDYDSIHVAPCNNPVNQVFYDWEEVRNLAIRLLAEV